MNFEKAAWAIGLTALGVIVAGFVMYMGKDLPLIKDARNGFDV